MIKKLAGYDHWTRTWNSQICIAHLAWSSSNGILTHRSIMYPMHAFGSSTYYLCPLQNKSQKSEILYRSFVKNLQMIIMKIIKLVVSRPAPRNKMIVKKSRGLCKNEQSYSQNSRVYLNKYYNRTWSWNCWSHFNRIYQTLHLHLNLNLFVTFQSYIAHTWLLLLVISHLLNGNDFMSNLSKGFIKQLLK